MAHIWYLHEGAFHSRVRLPWANWGLWVRFWTQFLAKFTLTSRIWHVDRYLLVTICIFEVFMYSVFDWWISTNYNFPQLDISHCSYQLYCFAPLTLPVSSTVNHHPNCFTQLCFTITSPIPFSSYLFKFASICSP